MDQLLRFDPETSVPNGIRSIGYSLNKARWVESMQIHLILGLLSGSGLAGF